MGLDSTILSHYILGFVHRNPETTKILCNASSDDQIPMFYNLSSLKFYGCLYFEWDAIRLLLGQAPKLQILAFESCPNQSYDGPAPDDCWEDHRDVPECLSLHLTTCHYTGFSGAEDEMQLVRQILKEARVLKTMKIIVNSRPEPKVKLCVLKVLSKIVRKFPTRSQTCQIAFDERFCCDFENARDTRRVWNVIAGWVDPSR